MCGIIGVHTINNSEDVIYIIFEGLLGLQHRGQDGVGIATSKRIIKKNGLDFRGIDEIFIVNNSGIIPKETKIRFHLSSNLNVFKLRNGKILLISITIP